MTINDIAQLAARVNVLISHYEHLSAAARRDFKEAGFAPLFDADLEEWHSHADKIISELYTHSDSLTDENAKNVEIKFN